MGINKRQWLYNQIVRADSTKSTDDTFNGDLEELYYFMVTAGLISPVLTVNAKDFGAKGDGVTDDIAAITAAISSVMAAGGGVVFFPAGTYIISASIPTHSGIVYRGAGRSATTIKPYQSAAFTGSGTLASPISDAEWWDMTWDGSNITQSGYKGQYSAFLKRCKWNNIRCVNFTATGFGSDFLVDCSYSLCVAEGNGRLANIGDPGMSGIGIGTGAYAVENTTILGCVTRNNKNYGIFFERQDQSPSTTYMSRGPRVVGCYSESDGYGIGDCGTEGIVLEGNTVISPIRDGITASAGSGSGIGRPGQRGKALGNFVYGAGQDGIHLDYSVNSISASQCYWQIKDNFVVSSTRNGFRLDSSKWNSDVVRGLTLKDNTFSLSGGSGVYAQYTAGGDAGGGAIADWMIAGNDVRANGQTSGTDNYGIHLTGATYTRPTIQDNRAYDDQATKKQAYGLVTDTGATLSDAFIFGNRLRDNLTGSALFNGTFSGASQVKENPGYNPVGLSSISIGASPFTYTAGVTREDVYIWGGTVSAIKITPLGGAQYTVAVSTNATVSLEPGDTVEVDYSVTPTTIKTYKR